LHHRGWAPTGLASTFGTCATLGFDRDQDLVVGPHLLCGSALKAPAIPKPGRPIG
jgi:hypothetical protein